MNPQGRMRQMSDMDLCQRGYFEEIGLRKKSSKGSFAFATWLELTV